MAYWLIASLLTIPETNAGLILAPVSFSFLKWQINMHEQLLFFFLKITFCHGATETRRHKPSVLSRSLGVSRQGLKAVKRSKA